MNTRLLSREAASTAQGRKDQPARRPASWVWLGLGTVLLSLSGARTVVPIAAWMASVFLLRFARTQGARVAFPALAVAAYAASLVALRGLFPLSQLLPFALVGLGDLLPFALDRLTAPRLRGLPRTLVFPLAATSLGFLAGAGQFGTFGAPAYTQVGDLPLSQLVAITGLWGVTFLIMWLAPVVNELWEQGFDLRAAATPVLAFTVTLMVVLVSGGAQLAFASTSATVRVAGIAPDRALSSAYEDARILPARRSDAERAVIRQRYMDPITDDLFARTAQAADAGAKIVVWSEAAAFVFTQDEAALLARARGVAAAEDVYLQIGIVSLLHRDEFPFVDIRAILIDPGGAVVWDYPKATVPLNDGNEPGPGIVPLVDTPYGRLATIICYDADFPGLVRQAGRADADILLVPSSDWDAVADVHARMVVPRAIENGVAVVRPTRKGLSTAVDSHGRGLGHADYYAQDAVSMIVDVPTQGRATVYSRIGDAFAWLAIAGLLTLGLSATVGSLRRRGDQRRA